MGQLIFNSLSLVYVVKVSKIVLALPKISHIVKAIKDGVSIFISSIVINFYLAGGVIILGLFASNEAVGYFSAASKIIVLFQSIILYPLYQSLFPHLSKSFDIKIEEGLRVLRKMFLWVIGVTSAGSVVLFLGAKLIILIIYGDKFLQAVICLRVVSVLLIITGISNVLGVQGLINMKKDKIFMMVTGTGAFFSIFLNIYFASNLQELGTSIAWVITETIVMIGFIYSYYRLKIRFLKPNYDK
jgi:PST family polysaccharide transporter